MKINGRSLGWAIVQFSLFLYIMIADFEVDVLGHYVLFAISILCVLYFVDNMERTFK